MNKDALGQGQAKGGENVMNFFYNRDVARRRERQQVPIIQKAYRGRRGPWPPRRREERIHMRDQLLSIGGRLPTKTAGIVLLWCPACRGGVAHADLLKWTVICSDCRSTWGMDDFLRVVGIEGVRS